MTAKAAFSPEEWNAVLEGPPSAGMIVVTAARGGMFRETIAMSKAYVVALANKVAAAHKEGGQDVSPAEAEAVQQITAALGTTAQ